jgi:2-polyprenyl-3-methyl-5-hydroxy-6-metoxy-1,4-benzoquinol methylase
MSTAQNKALADFTTLKNRGVLFHAMRAAGELGILASLATGQKTAQQLVDEHSLNLDALYQLLDVLIESELVERYQEDYALSPLGQLIPPMFQDFGDNHLRHLADYVRTGNPIEDNRFRLEQASTEWTLTPVALDMVQALDVGKSRRGLRVLEIACGSGVLGVTIAHRDPNSKVTLMDIDAELERARTTAENVGISNQINWIVSNPHESLDRLKDEDAYDLVVVGNLMHHLPAEKSKSFIETVFGLLKPEGELAIVDVFPGQEKGQFNLAVFSLELGLRSPGALRDPRDLRTELQEVGFRQIQYAQLPSEPYVYGLVLATR